MIPLKGWEKLCKSTNKITTAYFGLSAINFLRLLEQIITNLLTYNNRNVLSLSSGGLSSNINVSGPRSRYQHSHTPSLQALGRLLSLFIPACGQSFTCGHSTPVSSSVNKLSLYVSSDLPLPFSQKDTCDCI